MPLSAEIPQSLEKRGTRGFLDQLKESTVEGSKKIFDWFKTLFTKSKEKGLKETLMGSFLGFLSIFDRAEKPNKGGKTEPQKPAEVPRVAETQTQLEQLQASLPALFDHTQMKSEPYEMNKDKTITLCSLTAKKNIEKLLRLAGSPKLLKPIRPGKDAETDIQHIRDEAASGRFRLSDVIPTGDADDIEKFYLDTHANIIRGNAKEKIDQLNSSNKTVCDIVTFGSTKYGHRCVGFRGTDGRWYVLDPYRYEKREEPIPFEEYVSRFHSDIKFVVPIDTTRPISTARAA